MLCGRIMAQREVEDQEGDDFRTEEDLRVPGSIVDCSAGE